MSHLRLSSRAVSYLLFTLATALLHVNASGPDCGAAACHALAWCEFNDAGASVCACQPGTTDQSGGAGTDCDDTGYSVRYVVLGDPDGADSENPTASLSRNDAMAYCLPDAEGYFLRQIMSPAGVATEVNCIYSSKSAANSTAYGSTAPGAFGAYLVNPRTYTWALATTDNPSLIAPTGITLDSVEFDTTCADSGCWVLKGVLTTGDAFNEYGSFNTFFLPQANITGLHPEGDISYDYSYADVDWTFSPANHPCTSAAYEASTSDNVKISTCCISQPDVGSSGGFVANYRPTEAFVDWAGELTCDVVFERDGVKKCWKLFKELNTWDNANARCGVAGGHLAVVKDSAEKDRMDAWMKKNDPAGEITDGEVVGDPVLYTGAWAWIGLKETALDSDEYAWIDGSDYGTSHLNLAGAPWGSNLGCVDWTKSTWQKTSCGRETAFICEFDPPTFDETCIKHVIQRPKYAAPPPERPCWKVAPWAAGSDWNSSAAYCAAQGGTLPVIDDAEENWFLRRLLDWKGRWAAWLGVRREGNNTHGVWEYQDGETTRPTFYSSESDANKRPRRDGGYPDDLPGCVIMNPGSSWSNHDCERSREVVCEFERATLADDFVCDSDALEDLHPNWDLVFPGNTEGFIGPGKFKGMPVSPGVVQLTNLDPFFGQYSYEIRLDEVELRSEAGKLRGTVGVEHTVDTFLGLANFRPTGIAVLDSFATQVAIHLEKTNFFTVSTHGTNDYTFLEYVNMRLVTVYAEDSDFSGSGDSSGAGAGGVNDDQADDRTVRTDSTGNMCYVQVTFTMGAQYQPNTASGGLIPLDSVRAGKGTFFDTVDVTDPVAPGDMTHVCDGYPALGDADNIGVTGYDTCEKKEFEDAVDQECGPKSTMCLSPTSVPDAFVSFNVPLGQEVFEDPSDDLSVNIFVDMVINAVDTTPGASPSQMRTTLTASIPVVTGGINIFCDGFTAKTDLKDVANVDIIVGSAANTDELTRVRILEDIASTQLQADDPADNVIDSASIESGLLTLVLKGNESYFRTVDDNTGGYSMELDDVVTIHIMQDGAAPTCEETTPPFDTAICEVERLLSIPADDNSDSNGLDTSGYALNGAFFFTVDRDAAAGASRALLEPSDALQAVCPFNPPRPASGTTPLETCITRRDVRSRGYPSRPGAEPSAMEIASYTETAAATPSVSTAAIVSDYLTALNPDSGCQECEFMTSVLGNNVLAREIAVDFSNVINTKYTLNGRYKRAYWINPGYEWTPTQTDGASLFSVSQKIFLFALVSLDENWDRRRAGRQHSKRRMLLQTETGADALAEGAAGIGQTQVSFAVTPSSLLMEVYKVPAEKIARFELQLQLTPAEACMSLDALHIHLQDTMEDFLTDTASAIKTAQVTGIDRQLNGHACNRRAVHRSLLQAGFSDATAAVKVIVVFAKDKTSKLNLEALEAKPGVNMVTSDPANVVSIEEDYVNPGDDSDSDSDNTALIAGICGGIGGALVVGGLAFLFVRSRKPEDPVQAVQTINVNDLKSQLQNEV